MLSVYHAVLFCFIFAAIKDNTSQDSGVDILLFHTQAHEISPYMILLNHINFVWKPCLLDGGDVRVCLSPRTCMESRHLVQPVN